MPSQPARPLRSSLLSLGIVAAVLLLAAAPARAQLDPDDPLFNNNNNFGGVYVDPDGVLRTREADGGKLDPVRPKPTGKSDKQPIQVGPDGLTYISLPKLFAEVKEAVTAGNKVSDQLRHLGGLTQIRYVLVYPDSNDLLIAGPAETWEPDGALIAIGKRTSRPVMQLDDLVVALRQNGAPFGCTIDPAPDSLKKAEDVAYKYAKKSRKERLEALKTALGPQTARVFGTPADTRTALTLIAADYRLKRLSLGADKSPVPGLGAAVDDSRAAAFRLWFEPSYEPLLVSADGNAYELRGQRLMLKAGGQGFDPRGATPFALKYAETFTAKIPQLAQSITLFAELQNITDLNVLAALIKTDGLDRKVGWDTSWIRDRDGYPVPTVPVAKHADTVVNATSGSIVGGGVDMRVQQFVSPDARQVDKDGAALTPARERASQLRSSSNNSSVMNAPAERGPSVGSIK